MHAFLSSFLIFFAGWTLSAHVCVVSGLGLRALLLLSPVFITALLGIYIFLAKGILHTTGSSRAPGNVKERDKNHSPLLVCAALISPFLLLWSWTAFWALSTAILALALFRAAPQPPAPDAGESRTGALYMLCVACFAIVFIALAWGITRSDLDDAFYGAVAAFASANPEQALLSSDPMLGESGLPLIFPSYRFASFELLSGAISYLLSAPAMDVYYIYLLPLWGAATAAATFLLTREIFPRHWLLAGMLAFALTLLLGEQHRSPANFSFVRIFQGKAVFLSAMVPAIFYLTSRFFSARGAKTDLFLLACCQMASIGLTNFGMLMAPVAGFGAIVSNIPLALRGNPKKLPCALATLLLPLPYLLTVAYASRGSPVMDYSAETAAHVWSSVFGSHQQYLVGLLVLAGPILAQDTATRWRLAVPALLLFAVYLNPLASAFISRHITTPPVYWRVVWSFPFLVFAAVSLCMMLVDFFAGKGSRLLPAMLLALALALSFYSLPFHTLRAENTGPFEGFAVWKAPKTHVRVAMRAMDADVDGGRLLAPEEIAGVISRFEHHPRLISTRRGYLDQMMPLAGGHEILPRKLLHDFVNGAGAPQAKEVPAALRALDVSVIVISAALETEDVVAIFASTAFERRQSIHGYSIWARKAL